MGHRPSAERTNLRGDSRIRLVPVITIVPVLSVNYQWMRGRVYGGLRQTEQGDAESGLQKRGNVMYARVTSNQVQRGQQDILLEILRESLVPVVQDQLGFRGLLRLADPKTGKSMGISLWETETDMQAGEASGGYLDQVRARTADFYEMPPYREAYEVALDVLGLGGEPEAHGPSGGPSTEFRDALASRGSEPDRPMYARVITRKTNS